MEEMPNQNSGSATNWFSAWWQKQTGRPLKTSDKWILGIIAVAFLFTFYVSLDANKYRATLRVVEGEGKVGVNPTTLVLDFGDLARGTSAVRRVNLENGTWSPMYVLVWKTGSIAGLMDIEDGKSAFKLKPGTSTKIEFLTYVPASATIDQVYDGRVYLFKIPTFGL